MQLRRRFTRALERLLRVVVFGLIVASSLAAVRGPERSVPLEFVQSRPTEQPALPAPTWGDSLPAVVATLAPTPETTAVAVAPSSSTPPASSTTGSKSASQPS